MGRIVLLALAVVGGGIGVFHLPMARPLLARAGIACPLDSVSAAKVETMHRAAAEASRGRQPAPSLDALGLTIRRNLAEDVQAWVRARGLSCTAVVRGLRYLSCANVPASAVGETALGEPIQDLTFTFDGQGVLVGIDALRSGLTGRSAALLASRLAHRLRESLGAPTENAASFSASDLEGAFQTSYMRYRFRNYLVTLTAVQLPGRGVTVREAYVGVGNGRITPVR
jgi:hypothetical protein